MSKQNAIIASIALILVVGVLFIPSLTGVEIGVIVLCITVAAVLEARLLERKKRVRKSN